MLLQTGQQRSRGRHVLPPLLRLIPIGRIAHRFLLKPVAVIDYSRHEDKIIGRPVVKTKINADSYLGRGPAQQTAGHGVIHPAPFMIPPVRQAAAAQGNILGIGQPGSVIIINLYSAHLRLRLQTRTGRQKGNPHSFANHTSILY